MPRSQDFVAQGEFAMRGGYNLESLLFRGEEPIPAGELLVFLPPLADVIDRADGRMDLDLTPRGVWIAPWAEADAVAHPERAAKFRDGRGEWWALEIDVAAPAVRPGGSATIIRVPTRAAHPAQALALLCYELLGGNRASYQARGFVPLTSLSEAGVAVFQRALRPHREGEVALAGTSAGEFCRELLALGGAAFRETKAQENQPRPTPPAVPAGDFAGQPDEPPPAPVESTPVPAPTPEPVVPPEPDPAVSAIPAGLSAAARKLWQTAAVEARRSQHSRIEPEHLLIGVSSLAEGDPEDTPEVAAEARAVRHALDAGGCELAALRRSLRAGLGVGDDYGRATRRHHISRSPASKAVFAQAIRQARAHPLPDGVVVVTGLHLLAALLDPANATLSTTLRRQGADAEACRRAALAVE